jgi:CHAT domain-containing protein
MGVALRALDLAATFSSEPQDTWMYYHQVASNLCSLEYPTVALNFEQVALEMARELTTPIYISRSYALLGLIHHKLKDYEQAIHYERLALSEGEEIKGVGSRNNLIANSTLHLAHIYRESGDFSQALECYNRAIELHGTLNQGIYTFQAHRGKLLTLIALNDNPAASAEIKQAVALIEEYRPKIQEESNRNSFFDLAQSIYDIAIDFSLSQMNDDKAAYHYSELSHARSLLDLFAANTQVVDRAGTPEVRLGSVNQPLGFAEIMEGLPDRAQLLQYAVLDDKLVMLLITKGSIKSRLSQVTAWQISGKAEKFLSLLSKPPRNNLGEVLSCARDLYDDLIGPVEDLLDRQKQLYIIPDKVLNKIPFGALVSRSNRFLIEDYTVAFSPSSSVFIKCSKAALKKTGVETEQILSIGNPRFGGDEFPWLEDLRSAADEARRVAQLYERKSVLVADEATAARIRSEMAKADVIHYAGHYVVNPDSPLLSRFALAQSPSEANRPQPQNGHMTASEIYNMELPHLRLVVLSACQTGIERAYKGEGAISMARPFIKVGTPVVIASLWQIETESTAELMVRFHKYRKGEIPSTVEALKRAQTDMISDKKSIYSHPYFWASFVPIGGFADF